MDDKIIEIINSLKVHSLTNTKNMDGKTTIDLIEESQNCPQVIHQISKDFLEIETNYNTTLLNLENERKAIDKKYTTAIDNLKENHKKNKELY